MHGSDSHRAIEVHRVERKAVHKFARGKRLTAGHPDHRFAIAVITGGALKNNPPGIGPDRQNHVRDVSLKLVNKLDLRPGERPSRRMTVLGGRHLGVPPGRNRSGAPRPRFGNMLEKPTGDWREASERAISTLKTRPT